MTKSIKTTNKYIEKTKNTVNNSYRLDYHMMPTVGWMNDPNGLIYYKGRYHLFYQANPYDTAPGTMCWGHFVSDDLITYEDLGIAIAPEKEHTSIFSGGAIEIDGQLNAIYTLHYEKGDTKREYIYKSVSSDGVNFGGDTCIFDNETLPKNLSRKDFRDPYPVKIGDRYYVFVGGTDVNLKKGVIVVLSGTTLDYLHYEFCIGPFYEFGEMCECPCYVRMDGKDVIVTSAYATPRRGNDFKNTHSSMFVVGDIDFERGVMAVDYVKEIDKGNTFYAPQLMNGTDTPTMVGWLEMWNTPYLTHLLHHGWVGAFSIPRVLSFKDGDVCQNPVETLASYYKGDADGNCFSHCADLSFKFGGNGKLTVKGGNGEVVIGHHDGAVFLDTMNAKTPHGHVRQTNRRYDSCEVRVLLDTSSVEVFVDGGREVISSRIYIDGEYKLEVSGDVSEIRIKEVCTKQ
ncbi:MAG: GH32 C-terminal domain-containing protein [Clostridiales bacterium]|nr:GH32 C-terminal domain-containing protein [Clostridiales bacterium]